MESPTGMGLERRPRNSHSQLVEGIVLPAPVSGHPALELCNTFAGWNSGPESGDFLRGYDEFVVWAMAFDVVEVPFGQRLRRRASRAPAEAREALDEARAFRAAYYRVLTRPQSRPGRDWDRVADLAREAACRSDLVPTQDAAAWRVSERAGLRVPLLAAATIAAAFLTSGDAQHVHACPGRGCGWLFLDRSGRRRWCTMTMCGNRAKARRFAERHRG
ncbi:MAG TPA: CGNR zinc finger domain-containing protein [Actinomycetota bacterium]|jgi:predicted RNA-binding Zn ribbon-like protein